MEAGVVSHFLPDQLAPSIDLQERGRDKRSGEGELVDQHRECHARGDLRQSPGKGSRTEEVATPDSPADPRRAAAPL